MPPVCPRRETEIKSRFLLTSRSWGTRRLVRRARLRSQRDQVRRPRRDGGVRRIPYPEAEEWFGRLPHDWAVQPAFVAATADCGRQCRYRFLRRRQLIVR